MLQDKLTSALAPVESEFTDEIQVKAWLDSRDNRLVLGLSTPKAEVRKHPQHITLLIDDRMAQAKLDELLPALVSLFMDCIQTPRYQ